MNIEIKNLTGAFLIASLGIAGIVRIQDFRSQTHNPGPIATSVSEIEKDGPNVPLMVETSQSQTLPESFENQQAQPGPGWSDMEAVVGLLSAGNHEAALDLTNSWIQRMEPERKRFENELGQFYLYRGRALEGLGRDPEALEEFERTYYLWRDDTPDTGRQWLYAYDLLTAAYLRGDRYGECLAMLDRAFYAAHHTPHGKPEFEYRFHQRKLQALQRLKREDRAITAARELERRLDEHPSLDLSAKQDWQRLAIRAYTELGLHEDRLRVLDALIATGGSLQKEDAVPGQADFERATALCAAGKHSEARLLLGRLEAGLQADPDSAAQAEYAYMLSDHYETAEDYVQSLRFAHESVRLWDTLPQGDGEDGYRYLKNLYDQLENAGDFEACTEVNARILPLALQEYGETSPAYLLRLVDRGEMRMYTHSNEVSIRELKDVVSLIDQMASPPRWALSSALGSLGFALSMGNLPQAEEGITTLRRANEVSLSLPDKPDPTDLANRHTNIAICLITLNRFEEALSELDAADQRFREAKAEETDAAAWNQYQRARLNALQNQWTEAAVHAQTAFDIRRSSYGLDNFRTRNMLSLLSEARWHCGEQDESLRLTETLLEAEQRAGLWDRHRELILCARLAHRHSSLGNEARADHFRKELQSGLTGYYGTSVQAK